MPKHRRLPRVASGTSRRREGAREMTTQVTRRPLKKSGLAWAFPGGLWVAPAPSVGGGLGLGWLVRVAQGVWAARRRAIGLRLTRAAAQAACNRALARPM